MTSAVYGPMCVVCGRSDRAGTFRKSGFKCFPCKGEKSAGQLRQWSEAARSPRHIVHGRSTSPVNYIHNGSYVSPRQSPRGYYSGGSVLRRPSPVIVESSPSYVHSHQGSPGRQYVRDETVATLQTENQHLHDENRTLRQREAWLGEARTAHLEGYPCEWCLHSAQNTHTHPCPFSKSGSLPSGDFRYSVPRSNRNSF